MKKTILFFVLSVTWAFAQTNVYNIIPEPAKITPQSGQFLVNSATKILVNQSDAETKEVAKILAEQIDKAAGLHLPVQNLMNVKTSTNAIVFTKSTNNLPEEGYQLNVQTNLVTITASSASGFFYAVQTLFQLLPADIFGSTKTLGIKWAIPCVNIEDQPRFGYRGAMLDVGRHFFSVPVIKKYLDLLALHKMNIFHWHLTDDQGWRIEIKKYPRLTQVGSMRSETVEGRMRYNEPLKFDGKPHGGFYTQEEIKDVVRYAQSKFITVIPEIEMPGHGLAAIASYPELGCGPGPYGVAKIWGVIEDVYCPTEKTFQFMEDVLTEVMALFPSKYIHIGGDECPKTAWKQSQFCQDLMKKEGLKDEHELQSYFIRRIDKFLTSKGRKLLGWDEILEGGLSPNATVMSWRGITGGIEAAKQNHDVIMTPTTYVYLDYFQSHATTEPAGIGGFLTLEKVYSYEPIPTELTEEQAKHVLGAQCNLWTEYVTTPQHIEYMTFPRATAVAEIAWSPKSTHNWEDFSQRLEEHFKRLDKMKINYAKSIYDIKETPTIDKENKTGSLVLESYVKGGEVHYTTDFGKPTSQSTIYTQPIAFNKLTTVRAAVYRNGKQLGKEFIKTYTTPK